MAIHESVMKEEVVTGLNIQSNADYIDGTLGAGGHTRAILEKNGPNGRVLAFDWDKQAADRAQEALKDFGSRIIVINDSYTKIKEYAQDHGFTKLAGIVFDLGLSLDQLKESGRGFTFQLDEPLDMRFSTDNELTASFIVNNYSVGHLEQIFRDYGEEREANRIAKAIVRERDGEPITKTAQLVNTILKIKKITYRSKIHPATQIFQALRIAVNDELNNVKQGIRDAIDLLAPKGRIAVISFHSLEDKIIKSMFRELSRGCICPPELPVCRCDHKPSIKLITKKPLIPSDEEIERNYRARSAKLRIGEKL